MGTLPALFLGFCLGGAFVLALAVHKAKAAPTKGTGAALDATHQRLDAALKALDTIARQGEGPLAAIARRALAKDEAIHNTTTR